MPFDKIVNKKQEGVAIRYGVIHGNDTIVFIKSGANGTYRGRRNHKYEKMAGRVHAAHGYSVITADNPESLFHSHSTDRTMIEEYVNQRGFADYTLMLVGHSDGGGQILQLAQQFPQVKKLLGINPSSADTDRNMERLGAISQAKKFSSTAPRI